MTDLLLRRHRQLLYVHSSRRTKLLNYKDNWVCRNSRRIADFCDYWFTWRWCYIFLQNGSSRGHSYQRVKKFDSISMEITNFLKLSDCDSFNGHAFRRTWATILSELGIKLFELKQHVNEAHLWLKETKTDISTKKVKKYIFLKWI